MGKRKRQKQLLYIMLSGALLLGVPAQAIAEEMAEAEFSLEEYVVTASRMPTKLSETAANVTVVSREEIEKKNITSVAEALTQAGVNVTVEGGSVGESSSVTLNGDSRVVVLVDGRRINQEQRMDQLSVGYSLGLLPDLDSVEKIEVVRGAASSLYGSSGVGGVINIITRKGAENRTTASTEFGSWGSKRYNLQTGGTSGDISYMVTAGRWTQDHYEYKDPFTGRVVTMPNSDFSRENASIRLDKDFGDNRTLTLYFDHLREDAGSPITRPGLSSQGPYFTEFFRPDSNRQITQNNVSLAYRWQQGENITNNLQLYRNHYKLRWANVSEGSLSTYIDEEDGVEWNQTRRLSDQHTLLGGFDWRNTYVDNRNMDYVNNKMRNLGYFLEDRWSWDTNWTLTAGVRHDDPSEYKSKSTARFSLNRKINEASNAYLSWGQVYRGPDATNLFRPTDSSYKHNPDLKPEDGHTTTLGLNTKLPGGTTIQASLFSTYLKNAFHWDYDRATYSSQMVNIAEQKRRGLDISVTHPLAEHWDLTAGYAYLRSEEDDKSGSGYQPDIANSNPNAYRLGVLYHNNAWNVNVLLRGATGRSLDAFTSRQYWVTDVAASYQMNPDVKVYAKVYNLTNRAYETMYLFDTVGTQPMASRQFVFGVEGRL